MLVKHERGWKTVTKKITQASICQMREELDQLEVQAKRELKDPNQHAVGLLRMDLVEECRRRLIFITMVMFRDPRGS